jgi:hypothetical protein
MNGSVTERALKSRKKLGRTQSEAFTGRGRTAGLEMYRFQTKQL